jgi:hypothetical protein
MVVAGASFFIVPAPLFIKNIWLLIYLKTRTPQSLS